MNDLEFSKKTFQTFQRISKITPFEISENLLTQQLEENSLIIQKRKFNLNRAERTAENRPFVNICLTPFKKTNLNYNFSKF